MTDRERLIQRLIAAASYFHSMNSRLEIELLAEYLLKNGVIAPPCKVGDMVYFPIVDEVEDCIEENKITEVCSKGFYISCCYPPEEDQGFYIPYNEIGKTVFLRRYEAERALAETR